MCVGKANSIRLCGAENSGIKSTQIVFLQAEHGGRQSCRLSYTFNIVSFTVRHQSPRGLIAFAFGVSNFFFFFLFHNLVVL